jgi:hypothetical protein
MAALAIVALSAACGAGTTAPDSSGPTVSGPVPSTSTSVPTLGPAAPSSTAAGQTVPDQVDTSSTVAVPLDPAVEQAVKKGVQDFFAAYMACGQAPTDCHAGDFHSTRGTAVGQGTVYFQGLAARGEYFGPDLRGSYIVTQSVALEDATAAVAFSCWYDASILLGPVDANGKSTVLNDKIISVREKQSLYFDGTDWKVGEAATVQDLGDGNKCPPPDPAG